VPRRKSNLNGIPAIKQHWLFLTTVLEPKPDSPGQRLCLGLEFGVGQLSLNLVGAAVHKNTQGDCELSDEIVARPPVLVPYFHPEARERGIQVYKPPVLVTIAALKPQLKMLVPLGVQRLLYRPR